MYTHRQVCHQHLIADFTTSIICHDVIQIVTELLNTCAATLFRAQKVIGMHDICKLNCI